MKLFLTSSTITENLIADFELLVGKSIKGLKVAFIPDAGYGTPAENDKLWIAEERQELVDLHGWEITDFVLRDLQKQDLQSLFGMDVVYVNGGFSGYLANVMRASGFAELLPSLLNAGVVYVGSSAGSMVMSHVQDASSWYLSEPEPEAINIPGLGYIDFQIYPHVKPDVIDEIKAHCNPEFTYYLVPDGSAISINDDEMKFCGNGIKVINRKS